ncbi:MAG: 6-pyruvoyl-tetrahydropterin synthase-related protein [Thermoflexales bacterium]|nr:6-pyruvoyl-tetrahydropterin synthase-related protein [Thermoflexales bacterium]MDW8351383.1 6-pyruvoyl-tetrahydropterin synthase-related protein [Anaerolineae bacterium]
MQRFLSLAILGLICALASANLWLGPGIVNTRAGGDSPFLLIRTYELADNLRAGIFPARWMANAAYGLGYPFFNFYAALPYYLAAGLNVLGVDLLTAIKLTQTLGMFAAAGAMVLLAHELLPKSNPWSAALAGAAYALAPFHLVNLYVRGDSLSEFWAFVWYPLILWSAGRVASSARPDAPIANALPSLIGLSLASAALVVTHNVSALIFAPFAAIYAVATSARHARESSHPAGALLRSIALLSGSAAFGLALSAWFWLPALGEAANVQLDEQTTGYFNFANHFRAANLVQTSAAFDYTVREDLGAFAMGAAQAVLTAAGCAAWWWNNRRTNRSHHTLALIAALFALSTFMITPLSSFIWERVPLLPLAQFPWRFLSVQAAFGALLVGGLGTVATGRRSALIAPALATVALAWASLAHLPNARLNIRAEDVTPDAIQLYEWYTGNIGTTIRHEYLPETTQPAPRTGPGILGLPRTALVAQEGIPPNQVSSDLLFATPAQQVWRIASSMQTTVTLPLLYWPGWRARLNGTPIEAWPHAGSGWLALSVPAGAHRVELRWEGTTLTRTGEAISAGAVLVLLALLGAGIASAEPTTRRTTAFAGLALIGGSIAIAMIARAIPTQVQPPTMQTLDFDSRPFPHRDPVRFVGDGATYELIGAAIAPQSLRAGDPFTLTLRWRDDRAPGQITVTQELPMGGEFARLFRHARSQTPGDPRASAHIVLTDALPGPLLLKLSAVGTTGTLLTPLDSDGAPLRTMIAGKPAAAITLLGPRIAHAIHHQATPSRLNIAFDNGIELRDVDWFFASAQEVCFKPVWQRTPSNVSRADALQVSLRAFGADGRLLAQADGQPQAGLAPTWSWPDRVPIHDSRCVAATSVLRPNEPYTLQIVWYRLSDLRPTGEATLRGIGGARLEDLNVPSP